MILHWRETEKKSDYTEGEETNNTKNKTFKETWEVNDWLDKQNVNLV